MADKEEVEQTLYERLVEKWNQEGNRLRCTVDQVTYVVVQPVGLPVEFHKLNDRKVIKAPKIKKPEPKPVKPNSLPEEHHDQPKASHKVKAEVAKENLEDGANFDIHPGTGDGNPPTG